MMLGVFQGHQQGRIEDLWGGGGARQPFADKISWLAPGQTEPYWIFN